MGICLQIDLMTKSTWNLNILVNLSMCSVINNNVGDTGELTKNNNKKK